MNPNRTTQDAVASTPAELSVPQPTAQASFKPKYKPSKPRPPFTGNKHKIVVEIPVEIGAAFRSALDEISNEIGGRLEGPHSFDREEALTDAAMALGILRAAVFPLIPAGHRSYDR